MYDSVDYAFAYDQHKEMERLAAEQKAMQLAAIRKVMAKHFDCFSSDDAIEEAALELWQELNPEQEIEPLF